MCVETLFINGTPTERVRAFYFAAWAQWSRTLQWLTSDQWRAMIEDHHADASRLETLIEDHDFVKNLGVQRFQAAQRALNRTERCVITSMLQKACSLERKELAAEIDKWHADFPKDEGSAAAETITGFYSKKAADSDYKRISAKAESSAKKLKGFKSDQKKKDLAIAVVTSFFVCM